MSLINEGLSLQKGGGRGREIFGQAEGGGDTQVFSVVLTQVLEVFHTGGGHKRFPSFKRSVKSYTLSWGGGVCTCDFSIL